jgi:uncharacterized protein YfaS (alpha-2-macroglobulin family)
MIELSTFEPSAEELVSLLLDHPSQEEEEEQLKEGKPQEQILIKSLCSNELLDLYSKLPEIKKDRKDERTFFQREKTVEPEKPGEIVKLEFSFSEETQIPKDLLEEEKNMYSGPLKLLRYFPEGDVDNTVPNISITFSQDMVPLNSIDQLEQQSVPVSISPMPKNGGKFRWLGTKTLLFEPEYRFDMSTEYKVHIDSATAKSVKGSSLENDIQFVFRTPTAQLKSFLPLNNTQHPINEFPFCYLQFDQMIDPRSIIDKVKVSTDSKILNIRLMTSIQVNEQLQQSKLDKEVFARQFAMYENQLKNAPEGRHVWFMITDYVDVEEIVKVTVGPGVPSIEGPLITQKANIFCFNNYPKFKYSRHYPLSNILPSDSWTIAFNNNIDLELFQDDMINVVPELPEVNIIPRGNSIIIHGRSKGKTDYSVTISSELKDIYGQKLGPCESIIFKVIQPAPNIMLFQPNQIITIDSSSTKRPEFSVITSNLDRFHIIISQVNPENYHHGIFRIENVKIPGNIKLDKEIQVQNMEDDKLIETVIDLTEYLQYPQERLGQLFILVEPVNSLWHQRQHSKPRYSTWVQVTNLAIDCISVSGEQLCWANSLLDGSTITGATFKFCNRTAISDATGIAKFDITNRYDNPSLICRYGNDVSFISNVSVVTNNFMNAIVYMLDDRGIYRPNESVNIKGFVREVIQSNDNATSMLKLPKNLAVSYKVFDGRGQQFLTGNSETNKFGSFAFSFVIPDNINLGFCMIHVSLIFGSYTHNFKCLEFRTPEYSVSSSVAPMSYIVNGKAIIETKASYYSGEALNGALVNYNISQQSSSYSPPGWKKFKFHYTELYSPFRSTFSTPAFNPSLNYVNAEGIIDSRGIHRIGISFKETSRENKTPVTITAAISVRDINRQAIGSVASFVVHPSSLYIGVKCTKTCNKPNTPFEFDLIVTDIDGKPISDIIISITAKKIRTSRRGYKEIKEEATVQNDEIVSKSYPVKYNAAFDKSGYYNIKFEIKDSNGLSNTTAVDLSVHDNYFRDERTLQNIILISDRDEYQPGQDAIIFIQVPFDSPAEVLCIGACHSVVFTKRFVISSGRSTELTIPIHKEYIPNLELIVYAIEKKVLTRESNNLRDISSNPKKTAYVSGSLKLEIPPTIYSLTCSVNPVERYSVPGSETTINIQVTDSQGKPKSGSEVTVVMVDEAVLSLTEHKIADPLSLFHPKHSTGFSYQTIRNQLQRKDWNMIRASTGFFGQGPCESLMSFGATTSTMVHSGLKHLQARPLAFRRAALIGRATSEMSNVQEPQSIVVRSNFNPLVIFAPCEVTDQEGKATIKATLPDNLTRYRITAVAAFDDSSFGLGESFVVAQLPLSIRSSLPRFLNFGDKSVFSCVLQNQTNHALEVNVAVQYSNLKLIDLEMAGLKVKIPSLKRVELKFPMETENNGTARFQIGVNVMNGGNFSDAVEKEIPVYTPATEESFATYGEMDNNTNLMLPVKTPANIFEQMGGLQITTGSTALQALTDAFLYLVHYKFSCNEQIASRIISIITLKDVLKAFKAEGIPSEEKLSEYMTQGLNELYKNQLPDGSFSFWKDSNVVSTYVTVHVAHCFARCKMHGYLVDENALGKSISCLKQIQSLMNQNDYTKTSIWSIRSYAYYVLSLLDDPDAGKFAEKLFEEAGIEGLSLEGLSWVAFVLFKSSNCSIIPAVSTILRHIMNRIYETTETANFITSYGDRQIDHLVMLHSERRTDAIVLDMLLNVDPKESLIPKLVKGLLSHRKKGRWESTQENVFCLIALHKYFSIYEKNVPDFTLQVWLGDNYVGEQKFRGRTTDQNLLKIPIEYITWQNSTMDLILSKHGNGRLYYRIGVTYVPRNLYLAPRNQGFIIERRYEAVTDKRHVFKDKSGAWKFKAGELVHVKLNISNVSRRYHVAMVDKLPACLEVLNLELKTTERVSITDDTMSTSSFWRRKWYDHQNMRDERVEAFASWLCEGVHTFSYVCRVTSLGEYVVPPAHIEEMYSPEVFGSSSSDRVIVFE